MTITIIIFSHILHLEDVLLALPEHCFDETLFELFEGFEMILKNSNLLNLRLTLILLHNHHLIDEKNQFQ